MRPTVLALIVFFIWLSFPVFVALAVTDGIKHEYAGIAVSCGFAGVAVWSTAFVLPPALRPGPGIAGFLASFAPAFFMPDAFFLGVGLLFIAVCSIAGAVFGLIFR
jgi:hypothetical protein